MNQGRSPFHRDHHLAPFIAVTAGIALFSVMDALMKSAAIAAGATEVVVGVGGTGTNDGGAGALQALGARPAQARRAQHAYNWL